MSEGTHTKIIDVDWPSDAEVRLAAIRELYKDHPGRNRQFHVRVSTAEQAAQALDVPGFVPAAKYGQFKRLRPDEIGTVEIFRFFGPDHYFGT